MQSVYWIDENGNPIRLPLPDSADNAQFTDVIGNKDDTVAGDSLYSIVSRVEAAVGGAAMQLRVEASPSGSVEEDAFLGFGISIMDIDSGPVASGSIDITGISAVLQKSTAGGAFATGVITQPTFAKSTGLISEDIRFLLAEWQSGDTYKLTVSGIEVAIGTDTAYVKTLIWSGRITEDANVEDKIDTIDTVVDALAVDLGDFSGQTNLQSLLSALGIPDTSGKPLYTCLITDRLDNGTFGLSALQVLAAALQTDLDNATDGLGALKALVDTAISDIGTVDTVVDAIQVDIGDASSRTNSQTILAVLGAPDVAGKTLYGNIGDFVGQTNLQTLKDALGIPDTSGKPLYTCLVTDRLDHGTFGLSNLQVIIAAIQTDLGDPSSRTNLQTIVAMLGNPDAVGKTLYGNIGDFVGQTNLQTLLDALGIPDTSGKPLYTCLITDRLDHATFGLSAIQVQVDNIEDKVDGTDSTADALRREYGKLQIIEVSITAAADAGVTTVATITAQACLIKSVVIHADAAQPAHMTTCAVEGGASQSVEFIGTGTAIQASLDAENKQVAFTGAVRLPAAQTIAIDLLGSGSDAVDLTITIEYMACVDGGYLV